MYRLAAAKVVPEVGLVTVAVPVPVEYPCNLMLDAVPVQVDEGRPSDATQFACKSHVVAAYPVPDNSSTTMADKPRTMEVLDLFFTASIL